MATKVVISPNPKRTSERLDAAGNIINPRTKQVIANNEPEYIPPPVHITPPEAPVCPVAVVNTKDDGLSIQNQIIEAEKLLEILKVKKKEQIEIMKKQLAELEK